MPGTKKVRRVKWALSVYQKLGPVQLHKLPIALYCPHFSCACHKNRLLLFRLRNSNSPFGAWVFCQVLHVMLSMGLRNLFDLTILINWLVLLLILRSKYLPLTFMIIFLSCFDITQPKKKEKSAHRQQGAVWGHQSICKLLISLRSLITQRLRRWYPTGGGGISLQWRSIGLRAGIFHRYIPPPGCPEALSAAALSSVEQLESRWPARCL